MSRKAGTLLALAAVVAVVGLAGVMVAHHQGLRSFAADSTPGTVTGSAVVGPSGVGSPTPVDSSRPATATAAPSVTQPANPQSGQTLATDPRVVAKGSTVRVVTTFHAWNATTRQVMVGGYAQGVIEDGGTCTLTLTSGSATAVAHTQAHADASTTSCGAVTVSGDQLTAGTWQAVLSYRSAKHSGTAAPVSVEVPR